MEGGRKKPPPAPKILRKAAKPSPIVPVFSPKAAAASDFPAAPSALREHGGQAHRQGLSSGASFCQADWPDQIGHRGFPITVPVPPAKKINEKTYSLPLDDGGFQVLSLQAISSELLYENDLSAKDTYSIVASRMAEIGDYHVTESTPRETQDDGEFDLAKIGQNIGDLRCADLGGRGDREAKKSSETVVESETADKKGDLGTWEDFGEPPPAPKRTREFHRLDASHTPTKTHQSDTVLAARGRRATKLQTQQLLKGIGATQNNPSGAQQSYNHFAGNPLQGSTPQPALPSGASLFGLQSQQRNALSQQQPAHHSLRHPYSQSSGPSLGSPFKSPRHMQNAKMGSGYWNAVEAVEAMAGPRNRQPNAPSPAQKSVGGQRQLNDPAQGAHSNRSQAYSQPGFPTMGGYQQMHSAASGYLPQSFGSSQKGYNPLKGQQPNAQQHKGFGQNQASLGAQSEHPSQQQRNGVERRELTGYGKAKAVYIAKHPEEAPSASFLSDLNAFQAQDTSQHQKSGYTKSPSEYSFQQMPGAFEPYGSRSFDALPPPSLASDYQSSAYSPNQKPMEQPIPPGFEQQHSGLGMSGGQSFDKQQAVAPALQPAMEGYVGAQPNVQEPQRHEPQHAGAHTAQPRDLAAQASQNSAPQQRAFGLSNQPLMRPPPGLEQNGASFSVSEAQNDSHNIRPLPGFEPRYQEVATPPTQGEGAVPQPSFELLAPSYINLDSSASQAPNLAADRRFGASQSAQTSSEAVHKLSVPADTKASNRSLLDILADNNGAFQPHAQGTTQQTSRVSEQRQAESSQRHQEMGSQAAKSTQKNAVADTDHVGFSMEDLETAENLGVNQELPAHLEKKFRSLIPTDSDDESSTERDSRRARAISPPRIIGGIHHASRHSSPRTSTAGSRTRSPSLARRSQIPLRHTQPHVQPPRLPAPPGVVYMPSPYAMARPARAGNETSTEQLNRLLMIAHQDGYMPCHMTLFSDTSETAFERVFPEFKSKPRVSMAYHMCYEGWARNKMTHVPPRIIPPALRNWTNMPCSGSWAVTVDPRDIIRSIPMAAEERHQQSQTTGPDIWTTGSEPRKTDTAIPAALRPAPKHSRRPKTHNRKGKEPVVNILADEKNKYTSIDDDTEVAMIQHSIELSLKESLAKVSAPKVAGPAPKESLKQSKLSAKAPPFMAIENVVPQPLKSRPSSRGGSRSRRSLTPSKPEPVAAPSASRSSLNTSTAARAPLTQAQPSRPRMPAQQHGHKVSDGVKPVAPVGKGNTLAYIPDVAASITTHAIRNVLGNFGRVINVDINRQKKCAFAEFTTPSGYQATFAANPHKIGNEYIRVQPRDAKLRSGPSAGQSGQSAAKTAVKPELAAPLAQAPQQVAKPIEKPAATSAPTAWPNAPQPAEKPEVKPEPTIAWPNAPKPVARPLQVAITEPKEVPKTAPKPVAKPETKATLKPPVKAGLKALKPRSPEPSTAEEEFKPSTLLEPPKTPPKFRQIVIPPTPPTPRTEALIKIHSTNTQDKKLLALPEVDEVMENPPIIKKSAKTSKRAVEKAAKKAKALLAKEARAEVAGARLGMGKAVLEHIGALSEVETDVTITDEENGKKIKKPSAPKKMVVKGIEVIPGVEINENHSKDVYVDRSNLKEKFVISRGQLKEVDLEKKARKEKEVADTELARKVRAAEMNCRGKALASSADDWEEEEDRIAATELATQSRRGSTTDLGAGGPPVLMALGADFDGWKPAPRPTPPPPPPPTEDATAPKERPDTAMSMRSNMSGTSSNFLTPFPSVPAPGAKDPSQFVEPAVIPPPLNPHIVPTQSLSEIIAAEAALRCGSLDKPAASAKPIASSWAQLAAGISSAATSAGGSRRGSSEVIELRSRSASGVGNKNLMSRFTKAPVAVQSIKYDTNVINKRTVYILGAPQITTSTDISDSVSSGAFGAIYKMEFGIDADTGLRLAGILFRDAGEVVPGIHGCAWGAIGYYTALKNACDADYLKEPPLWPWPVDAPITVYLQEYPEEEMMRRMHHDPAAVKKGGHPAFTRRLCLVNTAGLHRDWHEEEMIAFCYASGVKDGNVQKCCVHNFGNSTIVFGSVEDAVMMRGKLLDKFRESKGMQVTFSSCPGENQGPMKYKRDNAYLKHLEHTMDVDVEQEIEEGHYREKKRRNSKWTAY